MKLETRYNLARYLVRLFIWLAKPNVWLHVNWLIVLALLVVGALFAHRFGDWNHFARSGSLVVIVSLWTYFGDFSRRLSELQNKLHDAFKRLSFDLVQSSIQNHGSNLDVPDQERQRVQTAGERLGRAVVDFGVCIANMDVEAIDKSFERNALAMAVIGTFVWGFGDLVACIV